MTKRTWAIVGAVVLTLAVGFGIGAMFGGGNSSPNNVSQEATPSATPPSSSLTLPSSAPATTVSSASTAPVSETTAPTATTPASPRPTGLPEPALGSVKGAETQSLFDWFSAPIPQAWSGLTSDGDSKTFADTSTCVESDYADCAHIMFISLRSGPNRINYGTNPVAQWAKDVCSARPASSVSGPVVFQMNGVEARFYKFPCQGTQHFMWYVPSKKLLVRGDDGNGTATVEAGTVQAVLESATWQ